jgi:hypothetical protein
MIAFIKNYLNLLDLSIDCTKSCCMRIGKKFNCTSAIILPRAGEVIPWVNEIRYLGVYFVASCKFKYSVSYAKTSFCQAVNALFGKIGPHSKADIIIHLIKFKCRPMPLHLHGTESCPLAKYDVQSLDFTVMRFLMKNFNRVSVI